MDFYNKKVLLIIHHGSLGGAERQGLGISKILTYKFNCEVNVLLTHSESMTDDFQLYAKECGVQNILFFGKSYLLFKREFTYKNFKRLIWSAKYLLRLKKELKIYKPDILIPFLNFPSKLSYYLYKILPSVKFTFWHQLGLDSVSNDLLEYIAIKNIPCIIANAENGLDMFSKEYKVKKEKLNVLPQYISLNLIRFERREILNKFSINDDSLVIGMIAHYRPEKLHFLLLESFIELLAKYDHIHLIFLGDSKISPTTQVIYSNITEYVKSKHLTNKITVLSGEKVEKVLSIMDIGVLVSKIEGVPNAVMEYMLYNLPVIATNHSGCRTLLKESDYLIQNDKSDLINKLDILIQSTHLRKTESYRNSTIIKQYSMNSYIKKLEIIMNKYV
jgi:glycosyltransferase involved in cell wall biosynthesis